MFIQLYYLRFDLKKEFTHGEDPFAFAFTLLSFQHNTCIASVLLRQTAAGSEAVLLHSPRRDMKRCHCAAVFSTQLSIIGISDV